MKTKKYICAANWKMNLSYEKAKDFVSMLNEKVSTGSVHCQMEGGILKSSLCVFPQAVQATLFKDVSNLSWGAQDFYFENDGAFTGQNSPEIYKELGADIMLIGHSERRSLFNETNAFIKKKIEKCKSLDLVPMLCVGETLEEKKAGKTLDVLKKQLEEVLPMDNGMYSGDQQIIIAYEPVWAIGSGLTADTKDIEEAHGFVKSLMGESTNVLYGGSVRPENAKELSSDKNVDGFLIGGASLKLDSFLAIHETLNN